MGSSGPPLLLLLWVLRPGSSKNVTEVNAVLGDKVDLKPLYSGKSAGFVWKQGSNKVAEWDYPAEVSYYDALKNRCELNISTGVLTIRDLTEADSHRYKGEALIDNEYHPTEFHLRVYPVLSKPNVICRDAYKAIIISCDHKPDPPTYLWRNEAGPITEKVHGYSLSNLNKTLTLQRANIPSKSLQCVVKNPAMEMHASLPPDCFKEHGRRRGGLIAVVVIIVVFLVVSCGIVLWCRKRLCGQPVGVQDSAEQKTFGQGIVLWYRKRLCGQPVGVQDSAEQKTFGQEVPEHPATGNDLHERVLGDGIDSDGPTEQGSLLQEDKSLAVPASGTKDKRVDHDEPGNKSPSHSRSSGDEKEETK